MTTSGITIGVIKPVPASASNLQEVTTGELNNVTDNIIIVTDADQDRMIELDPVNGLAISTSGNIGYGIKINSTEVVDQFHEYNGVAVSGAIQIIGNVAAEEEPGEMQAVNGANYDVLGEIEFIDPAPINGRGYRVFVTNGTAIIGAENFVTGQLVYRMYSDAAWKNILITSPILRSIFYIAGQDETGFIGIENKFNNTGIDYTFTRIAKGAFECPEFDDTRDTVDHRSFISFRTEVFFNLEEGGLLMTQRNGATDDAVFEYGGWIFIERISGI